MTDADTTYRFIPTDGYYRDGFWLLGLCPECGEDVPVAEINHIADLGRYLTSGSPKHIDATLWDSQHKQTCSYADDDA